jgi:Magnesium chelatase, subunit ChlI
VHSLAGFNLADELITRPPYSDPHHSASVASIVGGGQRMARPGAISCAHKGVLFLDDSTVAQPIRFETGVLPLWTNGGRLTTRTAEQQLREILGRNTFTDERGYSELLRDDLGAEILALSSVNAPPI